MHCMQATLRDTLTQCRVHEVHHTHRFGPDRLEHFGQRTDVALLVVTHDRDDFLPGDLAYEQG